MVPITRQIAVVNKCGLCKNVRLCCITMKRKRSNSQKSKEEDIPVVNTTTSIHNFTNGETKQFRSLLVDWYNKNKRDLPWRKQLQNPDVDQRAYAVWVSEIMLQQTQVATVIDYYNKWLVKWPTLQDLAKATLEEVNEMWSGLGYYSRGRRLHEGAIKVNTELDGRMPRTAESLQKQLPGIGRYTAGAIASIAYSQPTGLVDGNVIRVLCRMRRIGADSTSQIVQEKLWSLANTVVDPDKPGDFNQGLMELGATVCTPKSPNCEKCPVQSLCLAYAQVKCHKMKSASRIGMMETSGEDIPDIECIVDKCPLCIPESEPWDSEQGVQNYPRKGKKKAAREERTHVCIICRQCSDNTVKYCIVQRPQKGLLAGLWEFPSLKADDSKKENIKPESILKDVCGLSLTSIKETRDVGEVVHIFSHIHQTYLVQMVSCGDDVSVTDDSKSPVRWVTREEFFEAAVSTAMKKVFKAHENLQKEKKSTGKKVQKEPDAKQLSISNFFKPKS